MIGQWSEKWEKWQNIDKKKKFMPLGRLSLLGKSIYLWEKREIGEEYVLLKHERLNEMESGSITHNNKYFSYK